MSMQGTHDDIPALCSGERLRTKGRGTMIQRRCLYGTAAIALIVAATNAFAEQPDNGNVTLNKEQQSSISAVMRQRNIQPATDLNFELAVGTVLPDSVRLVPVTDDIAAVLPQFRNYSFFVDDRQELVMVDPVTKQIAGLVPIASGAAAADARTDTEQSSGSTTPRAAPTPGKKARRDAGQNAEIAGQGGEITGETPRNKLPSSDRQPNVKEKSVERRKTTHSETDVTVGRSDATAGRPAPDSVEVEELPPVARRMAPPPPSYHPAGPEGPRRRSVGTEYSESSTFSVEAACSNCSPAGQGILCLDQIEAVTRSCPAEIESVQKPYKPRPHRLAPTVPCQGAAGKISAHDGLSQFG
jgi:hypothetical protein